MESNSAPNDLSVEIQSGNEEIRIEQIPAVENGTRCVRISTSRGTNLPDCQVDLTEKELGTLLARAVRAGVLSPNFIRSLRAEFEI